MKRFGEYALDAAEQSLWHGTNQIAVAPKPFAVLQYLVDNPGRLITHDELLDALWPDTYVQPQVLRTYMLELRKVLSDDPRQPRYIQSLPKRGYRFLPEVKEGAAGPAHQPCDAPPDGFVDRHRELALLQEAFEKARSGTRQVVFVSGESGVGKSALVEAFCKQLGETVSVARGQSVQGFADKEHYYPILEALAQWCASPAGERASEVLTRLAPGWTASAAHHPPATARSASDLCTALEELTQDKPLVLVLEDLHWADEPTLDLVSALARRRAHARLLLLATAYPQHAKSTRSFKRLMQDLLMRRLCSELPVAPLNRAAVQQLLCVKLGQPELPADLDAFVHRYSEGNPLFVHALVDHLIAQGVLVRASQGESRWQKRFGMEALDAGVPEGLAQMIELDIEGLSPHEQQLLEAGSLSEVAFPSWSVAAALEEDLASVEEACDNLTRRLHFVRRAGYDELPDGSRVAFYVFAHGLYREVLYQRQPAARRAQRHCRIAERLAELFPGSEYYVAREIAGHYEAAGDWLHAIAAFRSAANYARQRRSYATTAELLQDALRMAEKMRTRQKEDLQRELWDELVEIIETMTDLDQDKRSLGKV